MEGDYSSEKQVNTLLELLPAEARNLPSRVFKTAVERVVLVTATENTDGSVEEYAGFNKGVYQPHIHDDVDSEIIVVAGEGVFYLGDQHIPYQKGAVFTVPRGVAHGLEAFSGTWLFAKLSGHIYDPKTKISDFRY